MPLIPVFESSTGPFAQRDTPRVKIIECQSLPASCERLDHERICTHMTLDEPRVTDDTVTPTPGEPSASASAVIIAKADNPGTKAFGLVARWPEGAPVPRALAHVAQRALSEDRNVQERVILQDGKPAVRVVANPMQIGQPPRDCALAMVLDEHHRSNVNGEVPELAPTDSDDYNDDPLHAVNRAGSAIKLLNLLNSQEAFDGAALAFVSELASLTGASRATIGFVQGERVTIAAMSNTPRVNARSALVRDLARAMDEAIDQAATVAYPAQEEHQARITLAHSHFCTRHECPFLCTIPILVANDDSRALIGAISLEYADNRVSDQRAIRFVENVGSLIGPVLDARRQLATPIAGRLATNLAGRPKQILGRSTTGKRILLSGLAIAFALLAWLPVPYHIVSQARIEGAVQQVLAAPVAGYIGTVFVRPGQHVLAGQPIVELDDRELGLERRRWGSELAQIQKRYGDALAREDQTEIAVQRARINQAKAQISILDQQLQRLRLVAPYDGVIIEGDLSQSLGAPVKRGETLVTIAPAGRYRIMIAVDERHMGGIKAGQTGHVLLPSLPGERLNLTVESLNPVARPQDGINVFEVQASPKGSLAGLRPGLSGIARLDAGTRSLLASFTDDLRAWLRMQWWRWRP